jgi:translocator protein
MADHAVAHRERRRWLALALFEGICFAAAGIGSLLTSTSVGTWYQHLSKPSWNPPDSVFGPVWSVLFFLMGLSAWLVWTKAGLERAQSALAAFFGQLMLNVLWSGLFFGLRNPAAALGEIAVLWLAILYALLLFWRIRTVAGVLFLPYLAWVSYAAVLNFKIWQLNG